MRDDLVGFLMGALDASEHDEIKRKLETDAQFREDLKKVERFLTPLSWDINEYAPPADLAARTCTLVANHIETGGLAVAAAGQAELPPTDGTLVSASHSGSARRKSAEALAAETGDWTFADFVVAAGICFAAACLFFPAILNSRYNAQLAHCQDNMRHLGQSLISYSQDNGGYFPIIPDHGKLAVAGAYAAMLREKGLVDEDQTDILACPSREKRTLILRIPRPQDVNAAHGPQLIALQRTMGGDYAYPLGYLDNGRLRGIRNQNRTRYVILADSPDGNRGKHTGTHGNGQNVLFEHGNVGFLASRTRPDSNNDDMFLNDRGELQAGMHSEDVVLASSSTPPVIFVSN